MGELYVMVSITGRKYIGEFMDFYKRNQVSVGVSTYGEGTASGEVLDYLGLENDEKGVFFCVITKSEWKTLRRGLVQELSIDVPGVGIVFLIPISSVAGRRQLQFFVEGKEFEVGEEQELKDTKFELIIAIANYGYNDMVMNAAKEGGARGGTVLHGKGVGMKNAQTFFGVSFVTEKELILIVTKKEQKNDIMKAVMAKAGLESKAGTILFSLPVTSTAGIRMMEETEEEEAV